MEPLILFTTVIWVAEEIAEMAGLREVRVIPAGGPRLRADPVAPLHHRVAMVHLAIQNNPRFKLDYQKFSGPA